MSSTNRCRPGDLAIIIPADRHDFEEPPEARENYGILVRVIDKGVNPYDDADLFWNVIAVGQLILVHVEEEQDDGSFRYVGWERWPDATFLDDALQPIRSAAQSVVGTEGRSRRKRRVEPVGCFAVTGGHDHG